MPEVSAPEVPVLPERRTYSADETAALLGIHRQTVVRAIARGDLPGHRIGKQWLIPMAAVDRIISVEPR